MITSTRSRWQQLAALEGLISEDTGRKLTELAATVPHDQAIVNVGAYKGKSTCYLAEGARLGEDAIVIAIDAWNLPGNPDGKHGYASAFKDFLAQVEDMGLYDRVGWQREFSVQAASEWVKNIDRPVGLLFIDGDHEYESVKSDWEAWLPHLVPGAVVVFDDYKTKRNPGVERFVHELMKARPNDLWEVQEPLAVCYLEVDGPPIVTYTINAYDTSYQLSKPAPSDKPGSLYGGGRLDADLSQGLPYEHALLEEVFHRRLSGTIIDVGAHVGNHTLWFAVVCGLNVVAFEPDLNAYEWLERNVDLNQLEGRVQLHRAALGNYHGGATWDGKIRGRVSFAEGSLLRDPSFHAEGYVHVRPLDTYELDDVCAIKVDVEGNEVEALAGGIKTIKRCRPIIWAEAITHDDQEMIDDFLAQLGYRLTGVVPTSSPLGRWEPR